MQLRLLVAFLFLFLLACGDDDGPADAADAGDTSEADTTPPGPATTVAELDVDETVAMPVQANVDAVRDALGIWHIYGENLEDVVRVQGYLQARDRIGQMDFIRRVATGRLAQFAGSLDSSLIEDDEASRFAGHLRNAEAILPTLSDEERTLVEAYSAGVTAYIQELRNGTAILPRGVNSVVAPDILDDWTPIDSLAIGRFQAAALSFDTGDDVNMSDALARWRENFATDNDDARRARLAGAFHDLFPFRPARSVFTADGFPNVASDSGTRALPIPRPPRIDIELPPLAMLRAAQGRLDRLENIFSRIFGDETRGSNSWVVAGEHTASGAPILANDPHLALTSPPLFWQAHLDTKRGGEDGLSALGQMIAGTPVSLLGFNEHIAWGLTTHGFDVTDVYLETITPGVGGAPDTVLFNGEQVAIETVVEEIPTDTGATVSVEFEIVPHHGPIIPETRTETSGMTIAWTGNSPSNEAGAFFELYKSRNVEEARVAFDKFKVGGQTLAVASRDGDIYYTTSATVPVRDPRAMTYNVADQTGASPCLVLSGEGEHEWTDSLSTRFIPHLLNPDSGFIATANADAVGVTADGDPHNDPHFIGCYFARGHRLARITEELERLVARGGITPADMSTLQNDAVSPYGRAYLDVILEDLDRAFEELTTPGTHADLSEAAMASGLNAPQLSSLIARLRNWSFDTPAAVEGEPSAEEIADSVATTVFNAMFGRLVRLALDDELDVLLDGATDGALRRYGLQAKTIHFMLADAESLDSYSDALGDTVLWDDIGTDSVETRGDRVLRALGQAIDWLETRFSSEDPNAWRWGELHTLRLGAVVPAAFVMPSDPLSIPPGDDPMFPNGFPRHGDRDVVDASGFSHVATDRFSYGSGPQQRLVVEMLPDGPRAVNALPGGNSEDIDGTHQADQIELWRNNEVAEVPFTELEVVEAAELRIVFAAE